MVIPLCSVPKIDRGPEGITETLQKMIIQNCWVVSQKNCYGNVLKFIIFPSVPFDLRFVEDLYENLERIPVGFPNVSAPAPLFAEVFLVMVVPVPFVGRPP